MNSEKAYYERLEIQNKILEDKYTKLLEVAQERFDRIQKAIEYIEWNLEANEEVIEYINFDGNFKKVLDILKGNKNE